MKRVKLKSTAAVLLCLCFMLSFLPACGKVSGAANASGSQVFSPDLSGRILTRAASYAEVLKAINEAANRASDIKYANRMSALDSSASGKAEATSGDSPTAPSADSGAQDSTATQTPDYSQTNVQVEGVDEGDIVKTDGAFIYVLRNNELIIFKADGASTSKISSVKICDDNTGNKQEGANYCSEYASDIYVKGDTAVVISSYSRYVPYTADGAVKTDIAYGNGKQISKVYVFNIADRSKPVLKTELGQDGYVLSSRLVDSTLYLISNHYVYNIKQDDASSYVPNLYINGASKPVDAGCISIMPFINSTAYTVVCAYDLTNAVLKETQSLLGGGTTVYMNKDTLYIANSTTDQKAGTPYAESVYTVIDYTSVSVTDITSFDLSGGAIKVKSSGSVPGSLINQFALDEYNGNLRVATSTYSQSWSEYTDKAKGFINYIWKDPATSNALYVLDASLKTVGKIEDLSKGEQIHSVRFDGGIGYIVTFRQVDPLFAVDLSDPAKPTVLSALKLPGFSEYLHVYSEGRLFGLGMDADEKTGKTNGMKLVMFDISNPANITVKNSLKLTSGYSNALYNHKAILISAEKGIIAFPVDNGYDIYGYSDEKGFFKRAGISSLEWSGDSRGLYIGNFAYIVDSSAISVLDMTGFSLINKIKF